MADEPKPALYKQNWMPGGAEVKGMSTKTKLPFPRRGNEYVGMGKPSEAGAGRGKGGYDAGDLDSPAKDMFRGLGGVKKPV